jgi:putative flippase GtrA
VKNLLNLLLQNRRFLTYCVIGMSGTVLDFTVFRELVKARLFEYQAANAISYASGTLLSFILNARFNFRVRDRIPLRMICFFGVAFLGWSVSAWLLHEMIGVLGYNQYFAKLATLGVVVILQYGLNSRLSFRKGD